MNLTRILIFNNITTSTKKPMNMIVYGLFLCITALLLSSCTSLQAKTPPTKDTTIKQQFNAYNHPISPDRTNIKYMGIQLMGSVALKSFKFNSVPVYELSGIAWDQDEELLYAVSDEGFLYHLKPTFKDNMLTDMEVVFATPLKGRDGIPLSGKYDDSEGLSLIKDNNGKKGDSELVISFEKKPRLSRYSVDGKMIADIKTPKYLHKKKYFRHKNKALESVVVHPKYGPITAAERPLKSHPISEQTLYSSSGKQWNFLASKVNNSSVTGLEILPNGDVLVLERAYSGPFIPINIKLRRIKLEQCNKRKICETETIAEFDATDGWLLDNFEGLARIKKNQYLIVSDDNDSPFQKTIFMLFNIL